MKVNIKGLVFTGFAAAILSANAMAAGENIVTSKSYVDAKIASGQTAESISTTSTTTAPNEKQVSAGLSALDSSKQDKDNTQVYKVGYNGNWENANSAVSVTPTSGTAYLTKTDNQNGSVTLNVNATTDTSLQSANSGGADENKIPTAGAVKAYVDAHSAAANFVEDEVNSAHTDKAPSGHAVASELEGKQPISNSGNTGTYMVGHTGDTWATLGAQDYVTIDTTNTATPKIDLADSRITSTYTNGTALNSSSSNLVTEGAVAKALLDTANVGNGALTVTINGTSATGTYYANQSGASELVFSGIEETANKLSGTGTSTIGNNSSDTDAYPSAAAVYNYVQSMTGGTVIPARNTSVCTDSTPCALVYENDGAHWRTMATANDNGGACGDAAGTGCNASNNPAESGTTEPDNG